MSTTLSWAMRDDMAPVLLTSSVAATPSTTSESETRGDPYPPRVMDTTRAPFARATRTQSSTSVVRPE